MTTTTSLKSLAKKCRVSTVYGAKTPWDQQDEWQHNANGYRVTLRYQGRQFSFDFWMGSALRNEPDAESCLESLLSDARSGEQTFEEFCTESGCDADSRKAEKTWKACQKSGDGMKRLLGEDYETFLYAERG